MNENMDLYSRKYMIVEWRGERIKSVELWDRV